MPEKIDESDPVFYLQKIEKGWFYETRGSLWLYFFPKDGLFHKTLVLSLKWDFPLVVVTYSEIVIFSNNHIFKLKMRQIARILLTNDLR